MTLEQTVSYVWMRESLLTLFLVVQGDHEIYMSISGGGIAYELVRPIGLYGKWFSQAAANRISPIFTGFLPVLLIAFIMPVPYRLALPGSPAQLILFLLSAVLGLCVTVSIAMLMHISMFFTLSHRGIRVIFTAVTQFLSGGIVPLPLFPAPIRAVAERLPFASMQNMPLQIWCGTLTGLDALSGIVFQLFWLLALVLLGKLCMRSALKRIIVQGG